METRHCDNENTHNEHMWQRPTKDTIVDINDPSWLDVNKTFEVDTFRCPGTSRVMYEW